MNVDVTTAAAIRRPRADVARYAADPDNAPRWYVNIKRVHWLTEPPLRVGSKIDFVARFLGREIAYTYEVVDHEPGRRLVMRTSEGPFPMEKTYEWHDGPSGTDTTLRNRGEPTGYSRFLTPIMGWALRSANRKDLARLKQILETGRTGKAE